VRRNGRGPVQDASGDEDSGELAENLRAPCLERLQAYKGRLHLMRTDMPHALLTAPADAPRREHVAVVVASRGPGNAAELPPLRALREALRVVGLGDVRAAFEPLWSGARPWRALAVSLPAASAALIPRVVRLAAGPSHRPSPLRIRSHAVPG
jgi:hypothetical protein